MLISTACSSPWMDYAPSYSERMRGRNVYFIAWLPPREALLLYKERLLADVVRLLGVPGFPTRSRRVCLPWCITPYPQFTRSFTPVYNR